MKCKLTVPSNHHQAVLLRMWSPHANSSLSTSIGSSYKTTSFMSIKLLVLCSAIQSWFFPNDHFSILTTPKLAKFRKMMQLENLRTTDVKKNKWHSIFYLFYLTRNPIQRDATLWGEKKRVIVANSEDSFINSEISRGVTGQGAKCLIEYKLYTLIFGAS
jgi:hypothetical protein